jgi:transposase
MGEELLMSQKERWRLVEAVKVAAGEQKIVDAAAKLGLSYRQMKRVMSRYRLEGDRGLCHRNRGRPSNRAVPPELKAKALEFYRRRLEGFGPTIAAEKLEEAEGIAVNH